jgi:hypothetical protein
MTGEHPTHHLEEVRRAEDDELEGFVGADADGWHALTVFGRGLASLAERWYWWSRIVREWRVVLPQEASPGRVRVAIGCYSLPGVPTATITTDDLAAGDRLTLTRPPGAD